MTEKPDDLYDAGKERLREHDYRGAIESFSEVIRIDPFHGSAWYNLACAQALNGERSRALDTLEMSILHGYGGGSDEILKDDDLESVHCSRLTAIAKLADELELKSGKDWSDAIPRYERIVRQHPDIARAWFNYGFALVEGGQPRASIDAFTHALHADYRPGTVMYNLGCAYSLLGERQASINWLMKSAATGFDVGGRAKGDRDLENVSDDRWLAERIADAQWKKKDKEK